MHNSHQGDISFFFRTGYTILYMIPTELFSNLQYGSTISLIVTSEFLF